MSQRFAKIEKIGNLKQAKIELNEGRFATVKETVKFKLEQAKQLLPNQKVIVDDLGLFINHLKGFPGTLVKYTLQTIGVIGILKLLENVETQNRKAEFVFGLGYFDGLKDYFFEDIENGLISQQISNKKPTWDGLLNIFVNPKFSDKTLADLGKLEFENYLKSVEQNDCFSQLLRFLKSNSH